MVQIFIVPNLVIEESKDEVTILSLCSVGTRAGNSPIIMLIFAEHTFEVSHLHVAFGSNRLGIYHMVDIAACMVIYKFNIYISQLLFHSHFSVS